MFFFSILYIFSFIICYFISSSNLSLLFPSAQPLVQTLEHNRSLWEIAKTVFEKYSACGTKGIDILLDPNFEDEVLKIFAQGGRCSTENSDECRGSKE